MKIIILLGGLFAGLLSPWLTYAVQVEQLDVPADGEELSITRYPAQGGHLIIWVAPGYGSHEKAFKTAERLAKMGVEIWHVDLADSLFMPKNTTTLRNLSGIYIKELIEAAHRQTGKQITLLSRSYGSIPILKGARDWQLAHQQDESDYLSGAILLSPELFSAIPSLGLEPIYDPISYATNIPIVIYQAGKRSNRWQLDSLLENLRQGGSQVFARIKPGVVGILYIHDNSPVTLAMLKALPNEILKDIRLLQQMPTPRQVAALPEIKLPESHGLDNSLKRFRGDPIPKPLDLISANGKRYQRHDYSGKVTVVNFWASWCPPCVEEIPSLNNLREKMQGEAFELISVNYAESRKEVDGFLKQVNVDFPVLMDEDGKVSASWNALVFPSTFIIGPDGKIHYGVNGAIHWDSDEVVQTFKGMLKKY